VTSIAHNGERGGTIICRCRVHINVLAHRTPTATPAPPWCARSGTPRKAGWYHHLSLPCHINPIAHQQHLHHLWVTVLARHEERGGTITCLPRVHINPIAREQHCPPYHVSQQCGPSNICGTLPTATPQRLCARSLPQRPTETLALALHHHLPLHTPSPASHPPLHQAAAAHHPTPLLHSP
jgi:hypothetical protein